MELGLALSYWSGEATTDIGLVREAERLGYASVWAAEAWGSDAVSVLAWIAAQTERIGLGAGILQMPARTPAMTAMTAMTLDRLSGGRFLLGLGVSGPQVVEGWHGVAYGKPLVRTREYVAIVRSALARKAPLTFDGHHYQIPYGGPDATGLGKPLTMLGRPRPDIPIYLAAIGPKNVALAAEIADGWLPVMVSPRHFGTVFEPSLREGFERAEREGSAFDIAPSVAVSVTEDVERARDRMRPQLALYIGGMGAKGKNFYNTLVGRYGFEREATTIQDLYLSGRRREAMAAIPDRLVDELTIVGGPALVRDRLAEWADIGTGTLIVTPSDLDTVRALPELVP